MNFIKVGDDGTEYYNVGCLHLVNYTDGQWSVERIVNDRYNNLRAQTLKDIQAQMDKEIFRTWAINQFLGIIPGDVVSILQTLCVEYVGVVYGASITYILGAGVAINIEDPQYIKKKINLLHITHLETTRQCLRGSDVGLNFGLEKDAGLDSLTQ